MTCIVQLDNFQGQYYPGNSIIGKVICLFSKTIKTRGIRISLEGKEHTEWTQTSSSYDRDLKKSVTKSVSISGNNSFLQRETTLAGEGSYPPNRYEYPFSFVLPKYLPATYVGAHGWIKYFIKAAVVIPFGFDHRDNKELKVMSPINFNELRGLQLEPMTYRTEQEVSWLFRSCGRVTMETHLEKEAFTLGESVKIKLEITNMSTKNIKKVEAEVGMEIEFYATSPTRESKSEYEKLVATSDTGVGAHGARVYMFDLQIPSSAVLPNLSACKLLKLIPKIVVTAETEGFIPDIVIPYDIELGHIPITTREQNVHYLLDSPEDAPYSRDTSPPPTITRERPPPYSEIDRDLPCQIGSPPSNYPVIPQRGPNTAIYPPLPQPSAPEESTNPSAPAEEELDDDFVLV